MPPSEATLIKQAQAAAWALNQIGRQDYINLCQRFIENAYGTSGQYRSAAVAGNALNMNTDPYDADVGDLVFFRPDASNGGAGHVGINIGNGQMVSSTNRGVQVDNFLTNPYWKNLLVGIGDPPEQWSGRPDAKDLVSGATTMVAQAKATVGDTVSAAWGAAAPYANQLMAASERHGVPVNLLAGLLIQESGGDPRAVSHAGAQGLMQFMPGTARGLGIDPFNPDQAIDAGAKYLRQLADMRGGDWQWAIGAYNAGPAGNQNNAETRNHIQKVMGFAETIGGAMTNLPLPGGPFGGPPGFPGGPGGPPGGDRNRDRNRQGGQSGVSYLLDYLDQIRGNVAQAGGEIARDLPQVGLPSVPSGGRAYNGPTNAAGGGAAPTVQIDLRDLQQALAGGDQGLTDFLRQLVTSAVPGGAGGLVAGAAGNAIQQGAARAGQAAAGGSFLTPPTGLPGGPPNDPNRPGQRGENAPPGSLEPIGPPGPPASSAERGNPPGWTDPSRYTGGQRTIIETANQLATIIRDAKEVMARSQPGSLEYQQASDRLTEANQRLVQLAPSLNAIEQQTRQAEEGTVLPGTTPYQRNINVIRRKPDGTYEVVSIPNPNPEDNPSITTANINAGSAANVAGIQGQTSRDVANINAGSAANVAGIQGATSRDVANIQGATSRYTADQALAGTIGAANIGAQSAANVANINSATQRATSALSAAVEQQRTLIDAQIRRGDLSLREGMARFDQFYKQNVEAPLAILRAQREAEQYRIQQQTAITQRSQAQSEHERGVAQIGQQMWQAAANAYNQTIPNTVGRGWGDRFQANLAGTNGYQPNSGGTFDVPMTMWDFANQAMNGLRATITPYAGIQANAQSQIGNPGQAMSGDQFAGLTNQAANVAGNALANPFVMPEQAPIAMPNPINPTDYVGNPGGNAPRLALPPPPDFSYNSGQGYGRG